MPPFCVKCGNSLKPEWKVCPKCGNLVGATQNPSQNTFQQQTFPNTPLYYPPIKNPYSKFDNLQIVLIIQLLSIIGLVGYIFLANILYIDILGVQLIVMSLGTFLVILGLAILNLILIIIVASLFFKLKRIYRP